MQTPSPTEVITLQAQWHTLKVRLRHSDQIEPALLWELKNFLKECIGAARDMPQSGSLDLHGIAEEVIRTISVRITPTDYPTEMIATLLTLSEPNSTMDHASPSASAPTLKQEASPQHTLTVDPAQIQQMLQHTHDIKELLQKQAQSTSRQAAGHTENKRTDFLQFSMLKEWITQRLATIPLILRDHMRRWAILGGGALLIWAFHFLWIHSHQILAFLTAHRWPILLLALYIVYLVCQVMNSLPALIHSPEDARRIVGAPALGYVPVIENEEARLLSGSRSGGSVLESYRVLRSQLHVAAGENPIHSLLITSTVSGEGKSTIAYNLAVAMALDEKEVILINTVFGTPTLPTYTGIAQEPGLTNVLIGQRTLKEALQESHIPRLRILSSGPEPPNPGAMLRSQAMHQLSEQLKDQADVLIFDSPTCADGALDRIQGIQPDGVIYVLQLAEVKKAAMRAAIASLHQVHAPLLGIVYNKIYLPRRYNCCYYPGNIWQTVYGNRPRTTAAFEDFLFRSDAVAQEQTSADTGSENV